MKINARVTAERLRDHLLAQRIAARLKAELERELQANGSDGEPDSSVRRDALERAVRRLWGGTI